MKPKTGADARADDSVQNIQALVNELTKRSPNQGRVRELAKVNGVSFSEDPIEMMNHVLQFMDTSLVGSQGKIKETNL